jgi:hypothetical protein
LTNREMSYNFMWLIGWSAPAPIKLLTYNQQIWCKIKMIISLR